MRPEELEALVEQVTEKLHARLLGGHQKDQICSDCAGTCARTCGFKMEDFLRAGADRIGGVLGMGRPTTAVAALIDHTLLRPEATESEIDRLCDEAAEHGFAAVCINPVFVERCRRRLEGSGVRTCTVIGFPLGATLTSVKEYEARCSQSRGAQELDMVIPVGLLRSGRQDLVEADMASVAATREPGTLLKVIIEASLLTDDEKRTACRLAVRAGADYVKTSTGFSGGGATVADVVLMRSEVGPAMGIKAAGGVRDLQTAQDLLRAGATRIGASAGVRIVAEARE